MSISTRSIAVVGAAVSMIASAASANAACTKPSGRYAGSGSGLAYSMYDGSLIEGAAISISVNINANGSASASELGKSITSGIYAINWSVSAANNQFNATTCQGTLVTSLGTRYTYTSANSGAVITFIYTKSDGIFALYSITLQKV